MIGRSQQRGFTARPSDPDAWARTPEPPSARSSGPDFSARLTIDVTPAPRESIKVAAFQRCLTVADMLRALWGREFPEDEAATP